MKLAQLLSTLFCLFAMQTAGAKSFTDEVGDIFVFGDREAQEEFLDPDVAFRMLATEEGPQAINIYWDIADGYYLYHDKFTFTVMEGAAAVDRTGLEMPPGKIKKDPSFGSVEINTGEISLSLPLLRETAAESPVTIEIGYQGCKEDALCYSPIKKQVSLLLPAVTGAGTTPPSTITQDKTPVSEQDAITHRLKQGGVMLNLIAFFGFGLLLSLTPCVFPMIPILSGLIVGQGSKITPLQGFILSLVYVVAMALMYAVLGIIAGSFQFNLQAASQNIWVITAFSLVFVALSLSMFGLYEIQLPAAIQTRLSGLSGRQHGGTLHGAAIMGGISAIIVGPCVAPPLAGALLYISQTGNAVFGGLALFVMGLGLGVPLLAVGASAGALLPRAGAWMDAVKRIFGIVMLGVAIWFMGRVLPGPLTLFLWALLFIISAVFMGALERSGQDTPWTRLWKGAGIVMLIYGAVLVIGAASGGENMFRPLEGVSRLTGAAMPEAGKELQFKRIKSLADLDTELAKASRQGKPVMLDFYADWCVTCIEMEKYTFTNPEVRKVLEGFVLLQADVTANDGEDVALLRKFGIYGPPAILFFGSDAEELKPYRLVGFVKAEKFIGHTEMVLAK